MLNRKTSASAFDDQGNTINSFDKVLVRNNLVEGHRNEAWDYLWTCAFFSHFDSESSFYIREDDHCVDFERRVFVTTNGAFAECVKYEGNEHLVGTSEKIESSWEDF